MIKLIFKYILSSRIVWCQTLICFKGKITVKLCADNESKPDYVIEKNKHKFNILAKSSFQYNFHTFKTKTV